LGRQDFERLVERLYEKMGYETKLTPAQKDKDRDVIAIKQNGSGKICSESLAVSL